MVKLAGKPKTRAPSWVDKHVGARVRMRRLILGMSQELLGAALGVSFQQIQKYENGTNRIRASRLHDMARALGVPIAFFYDGTEVGDNHASGGSLEALHPTIADFITSPDCMKLVEAFAGIEDAKVRSGVLRLVQALGTSPPRS